MEKKIKKQYLDHYIRINSLFNELFGYELFFIGGNLLGLVREGDFLSNDKDMDVAYFSKHSDVFSVRKEMITIIKTLIHHGEDIGFIRSDCVIRHGYIWWRINKDLRIDIMPMWKQNNKIYRPTFVGYKGDASIILPLKKVDFIGYVVNIPAKPEEKLSHVYGPNWRVPDSAFNKKKMTTISEKIVLSCLTFKKELYGLAEKTKKWEELSSSDKATYYKKNKPTIYNSFKTLAKIILVRMMMLLHL